jgi:type II secretory pathway predicted ATPase ExeA
MTQAPSLARVVAQLKQHRPAVPDALIAARATKVLASWGLTSMHDRVSRPLVNMVRNGTDRGGARGVKAHAIFAAMVALGIIPAVPREFATQAIAQQLPRRRAGTNHYWKTKYRELEARLRGGQLDEEVAEVPMLTKELLKWFGLERNPVYDELISPRDLWWSPQHKEALGILVEAAEHASFVALVGRRGYGKTQVGEEAKRRLAKDDSITIVEPGAAISRVLNESHLISAVVQALKARAGGRDELYAEAASVSRRYLSMIYLLKQERKKGRRISLWIDEAHELPSTTLLALKRFLDAMDESGRRMLGVILLGQHLEAAHNPRARDLSEVLMRVQVHRLQPMHKDLEDYLRFKIERAGGKVSQVVTPTALKAIAKRCATPLDANVLLAQLMVQAKSENEKPIDVRDVETAVPDEAEAADA